MLLCYAQSPFPNPVVSSLFLAGPTPRAALDPNAGWREDAVARLRALGYKGVVFIPEPENAVYDDYDRQILWETEARERADLILFWVPRNLETMPAYTTNIEFGEDMHSGRMIYGRPDSAPKNRYLDKRYRFLTGHDPYTTLEAMLTDAVAFLGEGAVREGGEAAVPLHVWKTQGFQSWYRRLRDQGHTLESAKILRILSPSMAHNSPPYISLVQARVSVYGENRVKRNESVVIRPDLSSVVVLLPKAGGWDVLLVREFRTAGGHILELPGGSCPITPSMDDVALLELKEETGLVVDASRLVFLGASRAFPTLCSHDVYGYALVATVEEASTLRDHADKGTIFGVDNGERITLHSVDTNTLHGVDWTTRGLVREALMRFGADGIRFSEDLPDSPCLTMHP